MTRIAHYTVSQLRVAATCPRIHYFDAAETRRRGLSRPAVTRIWTAGRGAAAGGGQLFHHTVERFNRAAAAAPEVIAAVRGCEGTTELKQELLRYINSRIIDLPKLATRPVELRKAFVAALHQYVDELAHILNGAVSGGLAPKEALDDLFGDQRKRVDVTFHVGDDVKTHVTGAIDYVFYDPRLERHRIVDYKLTPHAHANKDLFQVHAYALMHDFQHGTRPDAAVFYLHPDRAVYESRWEDVFAERNKIYDLLASMVAWERYDEKAGEGLKPPGALEYCERCKWNRNGQCEARLGDKREGARLTAWEERAHEDATLTPAVDVTTPPSPAPAAGDDVDLDAAEEADEPAAVVAEDEDEPAADAADEAPGPPEPDAEDEPAARPLEAEAGGGERSPLLLGWQGSSSPRGVRFEPSVLNTHVAVVGAAGSGKTWMAKAIAEEAVRAGVPVLAVDPQGDLVQFLEARRREELGDDDAARHEAFWSQVEPRVFTPGTSHGVRLSLDPIRLPTSEDLAGIENATRRAEEERTMLESVAANLVSFARAGGEESSQRTFLYRVLSALPKTRAASLRDIVHAIREPDELGIDDADLIIKKSEREKLARMLYSYVEGPAASMFSGGVRMDLGRLLAPSASGKIPLNILYLNALTDDDQKHFFLAALASELYRWMVTALDAGAGRPNLLFYIDEARDWIPAGGKKPPAKEPLIRLFTQGRKYGVGCLLCTQSPRSVDYNVFGNCSTKIIGRLEAQQDVERVAEWFTTSGAAPSWITARKGADKGSFVARWPEMPPSLDGQPFRGRILYSNHEGAWSPDRVERAVDGAGLRELLAPTDDERA